MIKSVDRRTIIMTYEFETKTAKVLQEILNQLKIQNQLRLGELELFSQYADKETRAPFRYPIMAVQNSSNKTEPDKKTVDNWFNEMAGLLMRESKIPVDLNPDVILSSGDDDASKVIKDAHYKAKYKIAEAEKKASAMLKEAETEAASIEKDAREKASKLKRESDLEIERRWDSQAEASTRRWKTAVKHVTESIQELFNAAEAASIPTYWLDALKESIQYDISGGKALLSISPYKPVLAIMLPIHTSRVEHDIAIIHNLKHSLDKLPQDKSSEAIGDLNNMIKRYAELREKK